MGDLLAQGSAWLSAQMKAHAAVEVTYRDGGNSVSLLATIGRTDFEVLDNETASLIRVQSRDYLIDAADLVIDGSPALPARGALIEEIAGDKKRTYEVMAPGPRTAHYRWSDPYHEKLRIHTKLIKVEEAGS